MKPLPQNIQAEESLIGSLLIDKDAIFKIIDFIEPKDFYSLKLKQIYEAYVDCLEKNKEIDLLTLSDHIGEDLQKIGGRAYLAKLMSSTLTSGHLLEYAKIIKDKSLRRQLLTAQMENENTIFDENSDINTVISSTQNKIFGINPLKTKSDHVLDIIDDLEDIQKEYSEKYKEGKTLIGLSSGIEKLDKATDGLRTGHFWTIGGWHGTGKTSFALNIVYSLLLQNAPVSIVSLEMGQVDILARLMGIRSSMSQNKIIKGVLNEDERAKTKDAKNFFKKVDLEIHSEFNIDKIKMQIRKDFYVRNVKIVVIDYIQKIRHDKIFEETSLMSRVSIDLANLSQELGITIILLSQISNESQKGSGAGAGFKGSGTIEAVSDLALVLKRKKKEENVALDYVPVDIHITKNKFGFDGTFHNYFYLKSGKFTPTPENHGVEGVDKF